MAEQIIEVEADSLEEAREQLKLLSPEGLHILSEQVVSDGRPKTAQAVAETTEAAFMKAQGDIPIGAVVLEKRELTAPEEKVITVEAFDEQGANQEARRKFGDTAIVKSLKLVLAGKKGFLGIGKKSHQYEAKGFQQAIVEITYQTKAKISARIGEKPIWSPINPRLSCRMPFILLKHIFIFTDRNGNAALESPIVAGYVQDSTEMHLGEIIGKIPLDVIDHSDAARFIEQTGTIPESVWTAISFIKPLLAQQAQAGLYHICIRTYEDPRPAHRQDGAIFLFYRLG